MYNVIMLIYSAKLTVYFTINSLVSGALAHSR